MPKLTDDELRARLAELPGWSVENGELTRTFEFASYSEGALFTAACAVLAEKRDHHPDLLLTWRKVRVSVHTHSEGGITEKDFELAKAIQSL